MAASFSNLYDYQLKNGVVIPQTSDVRDKVAEAFQDIFGADFDTDAETPQGRLIEAIALLFVNVLRVNALNANSFNITQAVGAYLDNLGEAYGVSRGAGEGDTEYRARVVASASRGSGFAASIRNAVGAVVYDAATDSTIGANNVVVLDNGMEDPQMLPRAEDGSAYAHSVSVDPHSVLVCVLSPGAEGEDGKIALAIRNSKSAGCGYSTADGGTRKEVFIDDAGSSTSEEQASFRAVFYRAQRLYVNLSLTVIDSAYTGSDAKADAAQAVKDMLDAHHMNDTVSKADVAAAVASYGKGIVCTAVAIQVKDSAGGAWASADRIAIPPYKYVSVALSDISVTVNNTLE